MSDRSRNGSARTDRGVEEEVDCARERKPVGIPCDGAGGVNAAKTVGREVRDGGWAEGRRVGDERLGNQKKGSCKYYGDEVPVILNAEQE